MRLLVIYFCPFFDFTPHILETATLKKFVIYYCDLAKLLEANHKLQNQLLSSRKENTMSTPGIKPIKTVHDTPTKSPTDRIKDLETELEKVTFHLRTVGEEIGLERCPMAWLSITMDWTEDDLNHIIDMFHRYRQALHKGEKIDLGELRNSLMGRTNNDYDKVKHIILALYRSNKFPFI